jgi:3-dehydroquinate synthase
MASSEPIQIKTASSAYPAIVGPNVAGRIDEWLDLAGLRGRARVVVDRGVWSVHGPTLTQALGRSGRDVQMVEVGSGEDRKNLDEAARLYDWLIQVGTDRSDFVIAVGGGVVGDLAGFVASTFLRGIALVQVPTTLLAQVDSSIGGKVAINHRMGKNLIGAFHQPALVVSDTELLRSLPPREYRAGWAEIVKIAMISDAELFGTLRSHAEQLLGFEAPDLLGMVIRRAVQLKGEVVGEDERESGRRVILNYGHTVGHAIEAATDYGCYLHGEAVAVGMAAAGSIARSRGLLLENDLAAQADLLARLGLPASVNEDVRIVDLLGPLSRDKKARGATIQWVFADGIGSVTTARDVTSEEVEAALRAVGCI